MLIKVKDKFIKYIDFAGTENVKLKQIYEQLKK